MSKKIALAADHAGFEEKEKLKSTLNELGIEFDDMGTTSTDSVDYPDYALKAARAVASGAKSGGRLATGEGGSGRESERRDLDSFRLRGTSR